MYSVLTEVLPINQCFVCVKNKELNDLILHQHSTAYTQLASVIYIYHDNRFIIIQGVSLLRKQIIINSTTEGEDTLYKYVAGWISERVYLKCNTESHLLTF